MPEKSHGLHPDGSVRERLGELVALSLGMVRAFQGKVPEEDVHQRQRWQEPPQVRRPPTTQRVESPTHPDGSARGELGELAALSLGMARALQEQVSKDEIHQWRRWESPPYVRHPQARKVPSSKHHLLWASMEGVFA
eukprot:TRINITY_DN3535_c0_g1_i3.p4 TRINITY_DN3535_c0_g1~~TRINITY_DN3535_c0_g1_i3.p4  ORF type:complete len:137 (+),score=20.69 TRINITY_DN3535_c0_g1_i3:266-676(+)